MTYNYFMIDLQKVWDQAMLLDKLTTGLRACKVRTNVAKCTLCTFSSLVHSLLLISKEHICIRRLVPMFIVQLVTQKA